MPSVTNYTNYSYAVGCANCGALNILNFGTTQFTCYHCRLEQSVSQDTWGTFSHGVDKVEVKENPMLYNLRIRAAGYGSTSLFEGSCLTYEQCDSIIQKLRQHQKDVTEAGSEKRQLIIEMTPTKFQE